MEFVSPEQVLEYDRRFESLYLWLVLHLILYIHLQIESQNPQDPTKLKEIQFDLEDVPASLLQ